MKSTHLLGTRRIPDPVPVAPFIAWCDKRKEHYRREGGYPLTGGGRTNYGERVVLDLGWEPDNGVRRLSRWSNSDQANPHSGFADRDVIETALRHAGVRYEDVYVPRWPTLELRARCLILTELADALTGALTQTRWCISCASEVEAVDVCLWCDSLTVALDERLAAA